MSDRERQPSSGAGALDSSDNVVVLLVDDQAMVGEAVRRALSDQPREKQDRGRRPRASRAAPRFVQGGSAEGRCGTNTKPRLCPRHPRLPLLAHRKPWMAGPHDNEGIAAVSSRAVGHCRPVGTRNDLVMMCQGAIL
jgi:hypothetical protein